MALSFRPERDGGQNGRIYGSVLFWVGLGWGEREGNDQNILCGNTGSYIHNTSVRGTVKVGSLIGIWRDGKKKKSASLCKNLYEKKESIEE